MYFVYILTNKTNKVLYNGVTNNLERRLYEHKNHLWMDFRVNITPISLSTTK